jgi:hypothetical protein
LIESEEKTQAHMQHDIIKANSLSNSILEITNNDISSIKKEMKNIEKLWEVKFSDKLK